VKRHGTSNLLSDWLDWVYPPLKFTTHILLHISALTYKARHIMEKMYFFILSNS